MPRVPVSAIVSTEGRFRASRVAHVFLPAFTTQTLGEEAFFR
jgi:hypothetical protein